jgi:hypothetical protein
MVVSNASLQYPISQLSNIISEEDEFVNTHEEGRHTFSRV